MRSMTQKFLYLIDYWVDFPTSDCGGLLAVIGENDNEIHDILLNWRFDHLQKYDGRIMQNVVNAQRFPLLTEEDSRIVTEFTT